MGLFSDSKTTITNTQVENINYAPHVESIVSSNVIPAGMQSPSSSDLGFFGIPAAVLDLNKQFPSEQLEHPAGQAGGISEANIMGLPKDQFLLMAAIGAVLLLVSLKG